MTLLEQIEQNLITKKKELENFNHENIKNNSYYQNPNLEGQIESLEWTKKLTENHSSIIIEKIDSFKKN